SAPARGERLRDRLRRASRTGAFGDLDSGACSARVRARGAGAFAGVIAPGRSAEPASRARDAAYAPAAPGRAPLGEAPCAVPQARSVARLRPEGAPAAR